jgi:hypothetical protein
MPAVLADEDLGHTTTWVAHFCETHPSAPLRWIRRGVLLRNGTRLKLAGFATPGGWRVTRSALNEFLEALTADRQQAGDNSTRPRPRPRPRPSTRLRAKAARVAAELEAEGF